MQNEPYIYRPGTGRDPQLMEMQARAYGWKFGMDSSTRQPHKPCMSPVQAWQLFLMVLLLMLLAARAQAQSWVTIDSKTDGTAGISYTIEVQLDTSTVSPTLNKIRTKVTATGPMPAVGTVQYALWAGPYGTAFQVSNSISTFPTTITHDPINLSPGGQRTISAAVVPNTGPATSDQNATWEFDATPEIKRVKVSYFNSRDYPVTIRLVDAANHATTIHEAVVGAHSGFIQTITLPDGVDAAVLLELVDDFNKDGPTWVVSPGTTTTVANPTSIPGSTVYPGQEPSTTTTVPQSPDLPQTPPNPSSNPNPVPTPGAVVTPKPLRPWQPREDVATPTEGVTSDFTIVAYREGVDKLAKILEGDESIETPPPIEGESNLTAPDSAKIAATGLQGKLPTAPTLGAPGTSSTITIAFDIPKLGGGSIPVYKTINFAEEPYTGPISIFRTAMLMLLTLVYFLLTFFTVRSAFAGK